MALHEKRASSALRRISHTDPSCRDAVFVIAFAKSAMMSTEMSAAAEGFPHSGIGFRVGPERFLALRCLAYLEMGCHHWRWGLTMIREPTEVRFSIEREVEADKVLI